VPLFFCAIRCKIPFVARILKPSLPFSPHENIINACVTLTPLGLLLPTIPAVTMNSEAPALSAAVAKATTQATGPQDPDYVETQSRGTR
jgi:hypothetical protein